MKTMQENAIKKYPTIGCCGIDCGLCPRYHTDGASRCPGCSGKNFNEKHPSCSIITCCFKKRGLETCADCDEFTCQKLKNWDSADSFVTHRNSISNLKRIRQNGLVAFIAQQKIRVQLLRELIEHYDDGRSKSFYCLSAALLPINDIKTAIKKMKSHTAAEKDKKLLAKMLKDTFKDIAESNGIELVYRRKA
ncbi:MAG: DUF3795 domain-containing protein [Spirochaetes bacterium]|nr:DUF3795 domain-containing protein [Spirochaetota bacterium]